MKIITTILLSFTIIVNIVWLIHSAIHCNDGFGGYPDVWDSEWHEKFHYTVASLGSVLIIVSAILICILKWKGGK